MREDIIPRTSIIIMVFACAVLMHPVYAQDIDYQKYADKGFDWFKIFSTQTINSTDLDPNYKAKMDSAINGGIPVAKKGFEFWIALHHFIIEQLLSNSPINIGTGIATIISLGIVGFAAFHFLKKVAKILVVVALIIIAIAVAFIVFGMHPSFLPY